MSNPVIDDLAVLVGFPTVSNRPLTELAAWLAHRCEDLGFTIEKFPDPSDHHKCSIVARMGPEDCPGLVLSGHMDVVPTEGQPWSFDPFRVVERDGNLYGRGTADMKGFFAATLQALRTVDLHALKRSLVLVWTHDEEVGCLGSAHLAKVLADRGPLPAACLIGEPTDFAILRQHPGHVAVELEVVGQAAHSSRPDLGINAIDQSMTMIGAIHQLFQEIDRKRPKDSLSPWIPLNIAQIEGGSAINIIPDRCIVRFGYRPPPGVSAEGIFAQINAAISTLNSQHKLRLLRVTPSLLTREGTPLQQTLSTYARHPGTGSASFATDGGNLTKLGCEPLIFGPGSITVAHQADEFIPASDLIKATDVIARIIYHHTLQ